MKAILSISLCMVLCSFNSMFAQQSWPKQQLKFGFGSSIYGSTELQGKTRYLEYERQLFSRFSLGLQGDWGNGTHLSATKVEEHLRRLSLNAHLFFAPLRKSNNQLKLGLGVGYHQNKYSFTSSDGDFEGTLPQNYSLSQRAYSAVVEYEVFIIRNWSLGSRLNIQQLADGNRIYFWGLNTGIRF